MTINSFLVVLTTTDTRRLADKIAAALAEKKLAGCVQVIGPVDSFYRWQGKIEKSPEYLVLVKTTRRRYPWVERTIKELHTYQTPEIIALNVAAGSPEYLAWLADAVKYSRTRRSAHP